MYEKLRHRVDRLFENAPNTKRAYELKEEFLANLTDKYDDLISEGKTEEEAINIAIAGVGDVDGIINELKEKNSNFDYEKLQKERKKSAIIFAGAIALYIIGAAVEELCHEIFQLGEGIGDVLMLIIFAVATFSLIYSIVSKPKSRYEKVDDSMVEEFKEWRVNKDNEKEIKKSIKSIVWCAVFVLYFIVSFSFDNWYISWVIFIIGIAIDRIVSLTFELRK
ncbi:permease prefix domain 1-containing protein [Clostridium hydrogenum]|uniref:permease prefix domain 1-containing protein n=1 Tax=Clostridium hydrogenum TaxID=2855764 RepID=UPI001F263006|nr:permease prefix domain 1-containing protein [Clostridium hydrogenum]